jgi:hypothetical protein
VQEVVRAYDTFEAERRARTEAAKAAREGRERAPAAPPAGGQDRDG